MLRSLFAVGAALLGLAAAQDPNSDATDANDHRVPFYSPGKLPAFPLAVRSPYTSAWSSTAGNGTLNTNGASFWNGNALGWEGIVRVDGIAYEWLGTGISILPAIPQFQTASPVSAYYDSQYSNFTFNAGPIQLEAKFFSPVIPKDLCRTSIPLSYLLVSVASTDGADHDVQLYADVDGAWASANTSTTIQWDLTNNAMPTNASNTTTTSSSLYSWRIYLEDQYEFAESNDQAFWGNFSWSTTQGPAKSLSYQSGFNLNLLYNFTTGNGLQDVVDDGYRGRSSNTPVFAFSHDLGSVGPQGSGQIQYTLGNTQQPLVRYLTSAGLTSLDPWWVQCYGPDLQNLVSIHYNDLAASQALAAQFEAKLKTDVDAVFKTAPVYSNSTPSAPPPFFNGTSQYVSGTSPLDGQYIFNSATDYGYLEPDGVCSRDLDTVAIPDVSEAESYYAIVAASARQVMGAYVLTTRPPGQNDSNEPLAFFKEISSDGNVLTVDVMFPLHVFWLYSNPQILRYSLEPLYQNQEAGFYPNGYCMHDLGTSFPNATGHVDGDDEYQPVEESGNIISMSLAYFRFSNDAGFLQQHYEKLSQWATYVIEYSLVPEMQLSTDDFAGQLANQTNLAIKGIVALQAMSEIATVVGNISAAQNYTDTAQEYYKQWEFFAIDPSNRHTLLAYQWRSSWGLLYNTYPDKLLNLGIIPQSLYDMQSAWYPTVGQIFGVPLDSRNSQTKSDWEIWTAATTSPKTRRLFIDGIAYYLNNTDTGVPFSDLYITVANASLPPQGPNFIARPVVGGHYAILALDAPQLATQPVVPSNGSSVINGTLVNGTNVTRRNLNGDLYQGSGRSKNLWEAEKGKRWGSY